MSARNKLLFAGSLFVLMSDIPSRAVLGQPAASNAKDAGRSISPAGPLPASPIAGARGGINLSFDADEPGGPARGIEPVIGDWRVDQRGTARGLLVDGSRWRNGVPSANLADQARRLYGERYAEFLDGVKAFAFFPLAVVEQAPPAGDLRLSVRFYPIAGKIDQAAGIAFGIRPDGSYACVRANALEDNILWARVTRGKRKIIDTVRNTSTPSKTWHTLVVTLRGKKMEVLLNGKLQFQKQLDELPQGKVGLWSKADSQVLFDDFVVESL